ncbi:SCP domain-containing protein [Caenorhabditis elegans]|uniref:SCP domain-containing protein n=1 Tax=Caenorhabditis elegans TaxID=6239 RepID=Q93444_CAEEL|nr:SCP domain-containing protein [Caenorhabditis elegans]CAA98060.1 SCP domain-containing protein [Caenorhabditis elegans]|eukprot:NP_502532.1 SCP-Like extracellular protein [Caenorhabditis elegans]
MHTFILLLTVLCAGAYTQFTANGQAAILNVHNTLRSRIAKGTYVARGTVKHAASDMLKMKWLRSLATSSQIYANRCPTGHSNMIGVGENLYWYWTSGTITNIDQFGAMASAAWEKEFQDYGWSSNTLTMSLFNSGVGHATQMAWAKTNLIGCGVKNCGMDTNGMNKVAVVCHYQPQGNYLNQNIYTSGTTCSKCPAGTSCEAATGLCV